MAYIRTATAVRWLFHPGVTNRGPLVTSVLIGCGRFKLNVPSKLKRSPDTQLVGSNISSLIHNHDVANIGYCACCNY